jgi:hypothetical protein
MKEISKPAKREARPYQRKLFTRIALWRDADHEHGIKGRVYGNCKVIGTPP